MIEDWLAIDDRVAEPVCQERGCDPEHVQRVAQRVAEAGRVQPLGAIRQGLEGGGVHSVVRGV